MKYLLTAVLAMATFVAVSCQNQEKAYEVAGPQTVELTVSGMT